MTIHFIRPYFLVLLIPAFLYLIWITYSRGYYNPWKKICDAHLMKALIHKSAYKSNILYNLCLFLLFLIGIVSLAGPSWKKQEMPIYKETSSLMIVLDLSENMLSSDLAPNRITRAKFKIRDLIRAKENLQMGLVVFSSEAFIASPVSQDANTLNAIIEELHPTMMPVLGSEMSQGLQVGLDLLNHAGQKKNEILLITASQPTANTWKVAKSIAKSGNTLSVLGVYDFNNQNLTSSLQQLSNIGGGRFYFVSQDSKDTQAIINNLKQTDLSKDNSLESAYLWKDAGSWLCLLLIPFALLIIREKSTNENYN